jgi:pimeloyl-ACP methyl ester carboxylesterase
MALAYTIKGNGSAVLWLHGLALDGTMWDEFTHNFASKYKHLCIDMPGFGKSATIPAPNNLEDIARSIKALLDELGVAQVSVVGHSMGGYVALALMELYPGLVTRLCMFHSHPFADDVPKKADRKKLIAFIEKNGTAAWMKDFYMGLFAEENRGKLSGTIKLLFDQGIQIDQNNVINTIRALMNRSDRAAVLEQFKGPVLFIVGNEDAAISSKNSLAQLDIPDISFAEMLDGVAHMGIFEAPAETKKAIEELLDYPID